MTLYFCWPNWVVADRNFLSTQFACSMVCLRKMTKRFSSSISRGMIWDYKVRLAARDFLGFGIFNQKNLFLIVGKKLTADRRSKPHLLNNLSAWGNHGKGPSCNRRVCKNDKHLSNLEVMKATLRCKAILGIISPQLFETDDKKWVTLMRGNKVGWR